MVGVGEEARERRGRSRPHMTCGGWASCVVLQSTVRPGSGNIFLYKGTREREGRRQTAGVPSGKNKQAGGVYISTAGRGMLGSWAGRIWDAGRSYWKGTTLIFRSKRAVVLPPSPRDARTGGPCFTPLGSTRRTSPGYQMTLDMERVVAGRCGWWRVQRVISRLLGPQSK
jgi:hypothetical protein